MNEMNKKKIIQLLGACCIIGAVFLSTIAFQGLRYIDYKKNGVLAQATIIDKYTARERKVVSGAYNFETDYLLDVYYFSGGESSGGKFIIANVPAGENSLSSLKEGDRIQIQYLPEDPQTTAIISDELKNGISALTDLMIETYNNTGISVEGTVENIDTDNHEIRIMFMTSLALSIGDSVTTTISLTKSIWDTVQKGESIVVLYMPDDPKYKVFAQSMVIRGGFNPYPLIVFVVILLFSGIYLLCRFSGAFQTMPPKHLDQNNIGEA
jgi:hypothetical protein